MIALRVHDVDAARRRLAIERDAVEVGTDIHVGSPKNLERRSVPYIQMLDPLFEKSCAGKTSDLRHTAASLAISSGANARAVQRMLGHKSGAMTLDVYADLFEDDLDAVATAMNKAAVRALRVAH